MVGVQKDSLFLAKSKALRGREGINLLVHACRSNSLSFSFLLFEYSLFLSFFLSSLFLNTCFLFSGFSSSDCGAGVLPCTQQVPLFIMPIATGFYYFSP